MYCFSRLGRLGGLGNQLFQIAATVGAAEKFGTIAKFPRWNYAQFFRGDLDQTLEDSDIESTYYEPSAGFSSILKGNNVDLFGFFQSRKYFIEHEQTIRDLFRFQDNLIPDEWVITSTTCSIHVRRTDYMGKAWKFVPLCMDYYNRAIKMMREKGCDRFIVFSDDIEWCKTNFPSDFDFVTRLNDIQSMALMSKCSNHIIANSTFSWWGSWLAAPNNKTVVAPHTWYSFCLSIRSDDSYQFCPEWTLINNKINLPKQISTLIESPDKNLFLLQLLNRKAWLKAEFDANLKQAKGKLNYCF